MSSPAQVVRFGPFELDVRAAELRRNGVKSKLAEKPFQVLTALLEKPGEVVTRDELRQRLWGNDTFVDFEHGLNTAVKRLREMLGDSAENPRFIETLPRHGYRLIVPVAKPEPQAVAAVRTRSWRLWLAMVALAVVAVAAGWIWRQRRLVRAVRIESLAVLPLENLSGNPAEEYFADGMTEALITELGKVHALRVISRQSVMHYKGTDKTVPQIARELNVDAVVEGSALRAGGKVRITTQLVHANPERHLWSESYERNLSEVIALQREITQVIARQIRLTLTPQEQQRVSAARPINDEAYDAYLKGVYHWNKRGYEGLRKSAQYFQQAIAKDAGFAPAYARLAMVYHASSTGYGLVAWRESRLKTVAAAKKALELDSSLAEAHGALAAIHESDYDWKAAETEYRLALELNPGSAELHYFYGYGLLIPLGRFDEALSEMRRAREFDPFSVHINARLGDAFGFARRFDEAIPQCLRTLDMDPNYGAARVALALAYEGKGMLEDNLAELKKLNPDSEDAESVARLARAYARLGRRAEARKVMGKPNRDYVFSEYDVALVYLALGEKHRALSELERAYEERSWGLQWLRVDWRLDELRPDPRFQDLLRRMNFPQ